MPKCVKAIAITTVLFCTIYSCSKKIIPDNNTNPLSELSSIPFKDLHVKGELLTRISKNMDRLEESKYQPSNVFLSEQESGSWPGDTEGRTILGLVLDAQAAHRTPKYLEQIISLIPKHLNEKGYMGTIYKNKMSEQQLSGNGWMLRGLCEYYEWKKDKKVLPLITSIANNLFLNGKGYYSKYPIDPKLRITNVGEMAGSIQNEENHWLLSSDIGCIFIGMDGLIQAYKILQIPKMKEVIEEMIDVFLKMDLIQIKAQTHASLTACRGLIRYAEITKERKYIDEVEKRWNTYIHAGMTENYENYNWFDRFDVWTEPCAIVDSYLLAVQLWQHTGNPVYRDDAELIYYNALCHTQRYNGGFGCDNCPGIKIKDNCLRVGANEASWCCTMRGGEGLSRVAQYSYFIKKDTIFVPFYHSGEFTYVTKRDKFSLQQTTAYPFNKDIKFKIKECGSDRKTLKFAIPSFVTDHQITLNGITIPSFYHNGFITIAKKFCKGDILNISFKMGLRILNTLNEKNTNENQRRFFYGPIMLGSENCDTFKLSEKDTVIPIDSMTYTVRGKNIVLTPIYHLMERKVWGKKYKKQIIF